MASLSIGPWAELWEFLIEMCVGVGLGWFGGELELLVRNKQVA